MRAKQAMVSRMTMGFIMAWVGLIGQVPDIRAEVGHLAPEIANPTWLNSDPVRLKDLRGKVVMVEFWTFGCWNCRNIEPYVKAWHQKYKDQGLVVIAIHSPEFQYEHDVDKVQAYIDDHEIPYAVPIDNEFATWRQYRNRYWSTLYLIDKQGIIQYIRIGEGGYDTTEQEIQRLLAQAN
ncbi:MAG: redoxin domain-containing protein [Nitrospirales bacterium]|nr:redoxin domain-containing protein [Nitrospirales bacterium]